MKRKGSNVIVSAQSERLMTDRPCSTGWRRMLRIALCYAITIQAFLSAFEVTIAAAQMPEPNAWFAICHGGDSNAPSKGTRPETHKDFPVFCAGWQQRLWRWYPIRSRSRWRLCCQPGSASFPAPARLFSSRRRVRVFPERPPASREPSVCRCERDCLAPAFLSTRTLDDPSCSALLLSALSPCS